jgi:LAO/AO transport system kinase
VDTFWDMVQRYRRCQENNGALHSRRQHQALSWMWERINAGLQRAFHSHPQVRAQLGATIEQVKAGQLPASTAARQLLAAQQLSLKESPDHA